MLIVILFVIIILIIFQRRKENNQNVVLPGNINFPKSRYGPNEAESGDRVA